MISVSKSIDVEIEVALDEVAENLDMWDAKELMTSCGYGIADIFEEYEIQDSVVDTFNTRDSHGAVNDFLRRINMTWAEVAAFVQYKYEVLKPCDETDQSSDLMDKVLRMYSTNALWSELARRAASGDEAARLPDTMTERDKMKIEAMDLVTELVATVMKAGE